MERSRFLAGPSSHGSIERLVMCPDRGRRNGSGLGDVPLRYPLPLFLPRFVETGRCEPCRMDAHRD
jgi:hypothetical protein